MVSKELLDKFKRIYQEKYKVILTDKEAIEQSTHLLNLMIVLVIPKPRIKNGA